MAVQLAAPAMNLPLAHWLRVLWGQAPALRLGSSLPFIADGGIHLPKRDHWRQHRAAAAHAMAHLVYSPRRFDATGLPPITRVLLALLEDARAEALASRELPGLMRLWQPLHTATPDDGAHFEALLQRLARALADPDYVDPHPWVLKGRRLFYLDVAQTMLALRQPAELHQAARRLGHDIGQMRLNFNAKTYRPAPAYRDDHRWMWPADDHAAAIPPPAYSSGSAPPTESEADDAELRALARYPEWDRLIQRLRRDWCTVIEKPVPATTAPEPTADGTALQLGRHLQSALRTLVTPAGRRQRGHDGERFDLDALVRWRVARRLGRPDDLRVYSVLQRRAPRGAVWLLVDQSASAASGFGAASSRPRSLLEAATAVAAATGQAVQRLGLACAVSGFSSNGRHAVQVRSVKGLGETLDADTLRARLRTLRSGGSTRLGAALRHATAQLLAHPAARRGAACWVLLLSDAQAHDIDIHDPRYLVEDARHAVQAAARRSVHVACLTLAPDSTGAARRIFGARGARSVDAIEGLPQTLQRLLA